MKTKFGSMLVAAGVALSTLAGAPIASAQPVTAGGKNAQTFFDCLPFEATNDATVTVTIPYGRKGRLLLVDAFVRGFPAGQQCRPSLVLTVGPASPESFGGSATGMQGGTYTALGNWWADLDANEQSSPGSYYGVPVPVELRVAKNPNDLCQMVCMTMSVNMVKK